MNKWNDKGKSPLQEYSVSSVRLSECKLYAKGLDKILNLLSLLFTMGFIATYYTVQGV